MEALRQLAELDGNTLTIQLPASFQARRVEVIVLPADETITLIEASTPTIRRRPSPKLLGTRIKGDIMSPVVSEDAWDALK
ncbi:MAG: hypothetical protein Q8O79_06175 [Pseudomonadota bacterium]|nr:hypothetical protein [Pseudomonadota bacterium]